MGESGRCVYNKIVVEPLREENHEEWFEWVRTYLIAQDLWEVVNGTISAPPEDKDHEEEKLRWRRKNAAALHIIQISCTLESFGHIMEVSEAKVAWDILNDTYCNPPQEMEEQVDFDAAILYNAIYNNSWRDVKAFLDEHPSALNAKLNASGQTALHVAAEFGHVDLVEELVSLVSPEFLEIVDDNGLTPLANAVYNGVSTRIAECMVNKNSKILNIANENYPLVVTLAFQSSNKEMRRYLYTVTPLEYLKPKNGNEGHYLLYWCLTAGDLDVALDLIQQCEELLLTTDPDLALFMDIAAMPSAFSNGGQLVFWKQWIYTRIKEIYELKLMHTRAAQILSLLCKNVASVVKKKQGMTTVKNALYRAATEGNVEFVVKVSKAYPLLIQLHSKSSEWNTFFYAVEYRQAEIFNLIHGLRFKDSLALMQDVNENNLLHVAGKLAPSFQLNRISGPALQMQRELQWFKEVESVVPYGYRIQQNKDGLKPEDIFKESHKGLRNEGEKWMKETASSCSVVGTLVVTIMFAAAFTVPGGNNQDHGYPILLKEKLFVLFIISDALSLFSSTTSVLMFLGILTSRYAEEDFLKSLPTKLIIGLSALFLSIATMMIAFTACILIMLQHTHSWSFLPIIMLASVPITLFVLLQFPLLIQMVSSTYGPGIFNRNVKQWL